MRASAIASVLLVMFSSMSLTSAKDTKVRREDTGTTFSAPVKVIIDDDDDTKDSRPNTSQPDRPNSAAPLPAAGAPLGMQVSERDAQDAVELLDLTLQCASKPIRYLDQHLNHAITKPQGDEKQLRFITEVKEGDEAPYMIGTTAAYKDLASVELDRPLDQAFSDGRPVVNVKVACKKSAPNCIDIAFILGTRTSTTAIPACSIEAAQRTRLAIDTLIKFNN